MSKKIIRFYYKREDCFVYLAHLDFMRLWERAVRRSGLNISYSQGFNPRPALTFALPAGVGIAVDYDPMEMTFAGEINGAHALEQLNAALPTGLEIIDYLEVAERKKSLMGMVEAAQYRFTNIGIGSVKEKLRNLEELTTEIYRPKSGKRAKEDILPLIRKLESDGEDSLIGIFSAGSKSNLRPDIFLQALTELFNYDELYPLETLITREKVILGEDQSETK